ncbi:MAG TPA: efflux RND transporter periplasmic adaptor subunit [Candidatus Ozemobacteraceae bacterium]|nr:efflux RND transporter periplasmic adaptor subunit [Candidatus Ozemobacteraceae bacterium]
MKRVIFYLSALVILVAITIVTLIGARSGNKGQTGSRRGGGSATTAVAVETSEVRVGALTDEGRFTGSLIPRSQFVVASKVAGRLKRLHVNLGDQVKQGQILAEIEDDEFVQAVAQAEADLAIAKANVKEGEAQLEIARREHERVQKMRQQKVSSESEVEASLAQLKTREARHLVNLAQVQQKEAAVKTARVRLSYTRLEALWNENGPTRHVGERFQDEGALLSANMSILSIYDLTSVTAVIDVVERDIAKIKIGQRATVSVAALPKQSFTGEVRRIAPGLNPATRQGRVEIEIPNPEFLLKPGMFAVVRLQFETHSNVAMVPLSAISRRDNREGVFFVDPAQRKAHFIPIQTGIVQQDFVEIASPSLSGLVVTLGQHLLEDGMNVLLPGQPSAESSGTASGAADVPDAGARKGKRKAE